MFLRPNDDNTDTAQRKRERGGIKRTSYRMTGQNAPLKENAPPPPPNGLCFTHSSQSGERGHQPVNKIGHNVQKRQKFKVFCASPKKKSVGTYNLASIMSPVSSPKRKRYIGGDQQQQHHQQLTAYNLVLPPRVLYESRTTNIPTINKLYTDHDDETIEWPNGLFEPIEEDDHDPFVSDLSPIRGIRYIPDVDSPPSLRREKYSSDALLFYRTLSFSYNRDRVEDDKSLNLHNPPHSPKRQHRRQYPRKNPQHFIPTAPVASTGKKTPSISDTWTERFHQMQQYRADYGDCNVPQRYAPNPQLGSWVNKQRSEYKLLSDGKKSCMTQARIRALGSIGFVWAKEMDQSIWDKNFEALLDYKQKHGDCLVPTKYVKNPILGRWVSAQRRQYRLVKDGDKTSMTKQRVQRLGDVGFIWRLGQF